MKELNDRARTLLRATQRADEPTDDDYDRIHSALAARIAAAAAVGAATTLGAKAASAATGASAAATAGAATAGSVAPAAATGVTAGLSVAGLPAMKVAAWVVAVSMTAGVGTAVVATQSRSSAPMRTAPVAAAVTPTLNPAPPAPVHVQSLSVNASESAAVAEPPRELPAAREEPTNIARPLPIHPLAPSQEPSALTRSAATPAGSVAPQAAIGGTSSSSLEAEVALIREARAAIQTNDTTHALAALEEHGRRFPTGAMAQDRDALQVFATCAAGQDEAARELATLFLARHPVSSYAAAVKTSCASKK